MISGHALESQGATGQRWYEVEQISQSNTAAKYAVQSDEAALGLRALNSGQTPDQILGKPFRVSGLEMRFLGRQSREVAEEIVAKTNSRPGLSPQLTKIAEAIEKAQAKWRGVTATAMMGAGLSQILADLVARDMPGHSKLIEKIKKVWNHESSKGYYWEAELAQRGMLHEGEVYKAIEVEREIPPQTYECEGKLVQLQTPSDTDIVMRRWDPSTGQSYGGEFLVETKNGTRVTLEDKVRDQICLMKHLAETLPGIERGLQAWGGRTVNGFLVLGPGVKEVSPDLLAFAKDYGVKVLTWRGELLNP